MTPVQLIESVYEAFNRGDVAYILSQIAPEATWRQSKSLPWGGDYAGPEGAGEFFNKLAAEMETVQFQAHENIQAGDEVFSFGYYEGKSLRTGQTGGAEWMFRWRVDGAKIVAYESYTDTAALLAAMTPRTAAA
jgi:ketosteroid isomerase-like protein